MAAMDRAEKYSRLVRWLKVALPLAALAILSTLFFVAETLDPEGAIPYAEVDVERILKEQGMTRPTFGGVTNEGVEIELSASHVRPRTDRRTLLTGTALHADLVFPDRGEIRVGSPEGIIDGDTGQVILQGGAFLESSTGYTMTTESLVTSYREASAQTDQEVRITGPAGTIIAGSMELRRKTDDEAGYLLVFKEGVRLLYDPEP
jgi:lipopolysaccharide export system protein LptC